ncbi:hypothetical protein [Saccharicrinis sp. 156]|uniref:hypothetical protein n=1 Tax=Saccharicrinis sp. 156 TaxID=3417574 RepID=UPI003D34D56B
MTLNEAKHLDSIVQFLYSNYLKSDAIMIDWHIVLNSLNIDVKLADYYLNILKTKDFINEQGLEDAPSLIQLNDNGVAFASSHQSFKKFSISLTRDLVLLIEKLFETIQQDGSFYMTKENAPTMHKAINESVARKWVKKTGNKYIFTPLGIEVYEFGSIESYLLEQKNKPKQTLNQTINTQNAVVGDVYGNVSQSSDNFSNNRNIETISNKTENNKSKKSVVEWIAIILGIIVSIIMIYKFFIE